MRKKSVNDELLGLNTVVSISSAVFVCNILLIQFLLSHKIPDTANSFFRYGQLARTICVGCVGRIFALLIEKCGSSILYANRTVFA